MDIFSVLTLLGGLAFFLYGMSILSSGLERASGGRLEQTLEKMTSNTFFAIALGLVVTAAIQSSSATTVIVVGLVNAKVLKLRQAIGIIMGANIGTTVTAHILRLTDIDSSANLFLRILKPTTLAPVAAVVGILLFLASRKKRRRDVGLILLGFSILFQGMFAMEAALHPLRELPQFAELFAKLSNPFLGVLVGLVVTAIIQSSSASVGILQALASTGAITFSSAFPIIMGQNIGTCITPVLASIGASKNAKRTAFVHVIFNVLGTVIFLIAIYAIQYTIGFPFWSDAITKGGIADFHTVFNVTVTLLLAPFAWLLESMAKYFVKADGPDADEDERTALLDERFFASPAFAISHARETVVKMANFSKKNFHRSIELVEEFDSKKLERARETENTVDHLQSKVEQYLLKLTQRELTESDNMALSEVLQIVNEFERIADHADNICDCAKNLYENNLVFSDSGKEELETAFAAVSEIVDLAVTGYAERDATLAAKIEPLEEVIDILVEALKVRHIDRLREGLCSVDGAFIFVELLYNLERIADHCSNIGVHVISYLEKDGSVDRHEYLREMHRNRTAEYKLRYEQYDKKYFDRIQQTDPGRAIDKPNEQC